MPTLFPRLLHSVSYSGSWGQARLDPFAFLDKAAELGYEGVMLMAKRPHFSLLDFGSGRERDRLRSHLERLKLSHVVVAGYNNFTADLEHGEVPQREIQVQYITELARFAHDIGASVVRVFTAYESAVVGFSSQWKLVVECLRESARRAADYGVTIGVQNHHDIAVGWESQRDLVTEIGEPNCRPLFDAWAPALHKVDIVAAARALATTVPHTTVADYQLRPRYRYHAALVNYTEETPTVVAVPMGEGFIDYRGFFAALADGGFKGTAGYEMCSPLIGGGSIDNLDRYARRFLEFTEQHASTAAG